MGQRSITWEGEGTGLHVETGLWVEMQGEACPELGDWQLEGPREATLVPDVCGPGAQGDRR